MMKQYLLAGGILAVVLAIAGGFFSMIYGRNPQSLQNVSTAPTEVPAKGAIEQPIFRVPDPDQAPAPLHDLVVEGYYTLLDTPMHAPEYVGKQSRLSCRNCHFDAGRERETISLVGVATQYPKAVNGSHGSALFTLEQKVQHCFVENLGGSGPPSDSRTMQAVVAYLDWISGGLPLHHHLPWLGLRPLDATTDPSVAGGRQIYAVICSCCHGPDGQGGGLAPPLWGDGSFTSAASMSKQPMLASFIYHFMPYRKHNLAPTQASDAAAFVLTRPRAQPQAKVPPLPESPPATKEARAHITVPEAMPYEKPAEMLDAKELEKRAQEIIKSGKAEIPASQTSKPEGKPSSESK